MSVRTQQSCVRFRFVLQVVVRGFVCAKSSLQVHFGFTVCEQLRRVYVRMSVRVCKVRGCSLEYERRVVCGCTSGEECICEV